MKTGIFASGVWCFCKSKGVADDMNYKTMIFELVNEVQSEWILSQIYKFIQNIMK